ncbi:MAG: helicase-associated domain-containing protein [Chloroflexi bacterium]|nr:helicase-associated domain-containing protein [Chloroflexota bacterium]MBP8056723.1 helicase-associated domain-containing protein [Chloroflexota bacterium]
MRTLEQALLDHELIVLRVIGEWWELDLTGADKPKCAKTLAKTLTNLSMPEEVSYLSPEEASSINRLVLNRGRLPVATFSREFGEVRQMGPARLEREEPWYDPISPAESLWYRGFLYRAFQETPEGLIEFYYLPDEFLEQFPQPKSIPTPATPELKTPGVKAATTHPTPTSVPIPALAPIPTPVPPASLKAAAAPSQFTPTTTDAVDDLTAILAAAQRETLNQEILEQLYPYLLNPHPDRCHLLINLAWEMNLLRQAENGVRPTRSAVDWLKQSRAAQLRALLEAWSSSDWNDLCHTPGLVCEGSGWENEPILARTGLLEALSPDTQWYTFSDLLAFIKETNPDFQRPDGNYDTWYIRDREQGSYITGFDKWEQVEGRLLRFLVRGPLLWLGAVEATDQLFRLTPAGQLWLKHEKPNDHEVAVPPVVHADATILVPVNAERQHRFQIARVAEPLPQQPGKPFIYRLTPASLELARSQGIEPDRVLQFLEKTSGRPVPASTRRAVERWTEKGTEARLEQVVVLRVKEADILDKLQNNAKTRPFLGERLGDLAVTVRANEWEELRNAAAQLGLLLDTVKVF